MRPAGKNDLTYLAIRVTIQTLPRDGDLPGPRERVDTTTYLTTTAAGEHGYTANDTAGDQVERSKHRQMEALPM